MKVKNKWSKDRNISLTLFSNKVSNSYCIHYNIQFFKFSNVPIPQVISRLYITTLYKCIYTSIKQPCPKIANTLRRVSTTEKSTKFILNTTDTSFSYIPFSKSSFLVTTTTSFCQSISCSCSAYMLSTSTTTDPSTTLQLPRHLIPTSMVSSVPLDTNETSYGFILFFLKCFNTNKLFFAQLCSEQCC